MVATTHIPSGVGMGSHAPYPQSRLPHGEGNSFAPGGAPSYFGASLQRSNSASSTLGGGGREFLHEDYGGLRFAKDADEDDSAPPETVEIVPWRMRERMKTMDVALVLCLNIGTDPPDVVRASPYARKECWVDPFSMPAQKALETIGKTLQSQYERWQSRARYRPSLDPTVDEVKHLSVSLRRHAKQDRVLFHYNGHGVPRPTQNGEIWVFNKSYTQYIPLLVYDLQSWIGTPSIYVFDCSAAGILLSHFLPNGSGGGASSADGVTPQAAPNSGHSGAQGEAIVLAACGADETLPSNPELCADVFTSCLTTPITIALRWFITQNEKSMSHLDASFIDRIPGKLTDRKTPLGELNWIFTAISDTIAWNILPRELFQKLFRQDLLVASLFRNFLLAERIMKSEGCTPCSLPALPPTSHHPLWRSWDLAAEICLNQLYKISHPHPPSTELTFQPSRFFAEQLTAFEVWLQFGSSSKPPPQQLPMVLQVLLSQVHRLRALLLLKKFLDLGPWAVNLALSVGIFPYVLKLLQSPASELRQVLVFIWSKILALDPSCQLDLVKDEGHAYFITHLAAGIQVTSSSSSSGGSGTHHGSHGPSAMPPDQKVMVTFILSAICNNCPQGQRSCVQQYLHRICARLLADPHDDVRRWICLCLAKLWDKFEDAKRIAIDDKLPKLLSGRLQEDQRPEVRAAAAFALGTLVGFQFDGSLYGPTTDRGYVDEFLRQRAHNDLTVAVELLWGCQDASPFVRRESVLALANFVLHTYHQPRFEIVARHFKNQASSQRNGTPGSSGSSSLQAQQLQNQGSGARPNAADTSHGLGGGEDASTDERFPVGVGVHVDDTVVDAIGVDATYYVHLWHVLKEMQAKDPFPKVVRAVKAIVSRVNAAILAEDQQEQENAAASSGGVTPGAQVATSPRSAMQREGSAPNLPAHSPLHSDHRQPPQQSQQQQQLHAQARGTSATTSAHNGGGHPVATTSGSGMAMRPTQSVGNLRGVGNGSAAAMANNLRQQQQQQQQQHPLGNGSMPHPRNGQHHNHNHLQQQQSLPVAAPLPSLPPLPTHGRQQDFPDALVSTLYDRQKARFNEPIMDPIHENDDPLSEKGSEKLERMRRFESIRQAALKIAPGFSAAEKPASDPVPTSQLLYASSSSSSASLSASPASILYQQSLLSARSDRDKYDVKSFSMTLRQRAVLTNEAEMTSLLLFHPYEKTLIIADEKDQISLYNFEQSEKKALSFNNKNAAGSRLTSLSWINETEESLLTCGSDDGVIRIYHGLHTPAMAQQPPQLLTAFAAVPDLVPSTRGSGLVTNWQQRAGMLYAGGNSSVLRGWDLRQEQCAWSIPTQTDSCITTLASDESIGNGGLVVAGFGDGTLRLFDARASRPEFSLKCAMNEHASWVVQTHLYAGKHELLSGSVSGELKFWDLRNPSTSLRTLEAHCQPMTALAVHDYAPILASGSHNQFIKVFRTDGEQLALIRYHEGFLGERIGPVSCLAFHPHRLLLAAGATDSVIAIYSADK